MEDNVRNQFVQYTLEEANRHNFDQSYRMSCENHNRIVDVFNAVADINVTTAMRRWMRRTDIVAEFAGDAIAITQCKKVVGVLASFEHNKVNNTCYRDQPVWVEGLLFFQVKGQPDLTPSSPEVPWHRKNYTPARERR